MIVMTMATLTVWWFDVFFFTRQLVAEQGSINVLTV